MKFLTTVIDLPKSMYTIEDAKREVRRKVARILAICLTLVIYDALFIILPKLVKEINIAVTTASAKIIRQIEMCIYRLVDAIVILPRATTI